MKPEHIVSIIEHARRDFGPLSPTPPPVWTGAPALKIIDCVLSLNRDYKRVVEPRVNEFGRTHPGVRSCADLREMITTAESPAGFLEGHLRTKDPSRAATLLGVTEFALLAQASFKQDDEEARLAAWAADARPGDYLEVGVRGFALAGFQYLRILFGADTVKPDRHIIRWVAQATGREEHEVGDVEALYAMERAAKQGEFSAAWLDHEVWKRATTH
jgi:hypothetical protein